MSRSQSRCEHGEAVRSVRRGRRPPQLIRDMQTRGHVLSSSLMLRLASHHLAVFWSFLLAR
ncbi:hypothetical protein [Methanoregula sp.]|uniref:hypothetical protein n=1 Tax=Methanoregula sp. TaxID=2052170 RepID=UPI003C705662